MKDTVVMANDYPETVLSGGEKENEKVIEKIGNQLNTSSRIVSVRGVEFNLERKEDFDQEFFNRPMTPFLREREE